MAAAAAIRGGTDEQAKARLQQKTILLTNGGRTNDLSFNQSAWEAISKFSREIGNDANAFYEVPALSNVQQYNAYDFAIAKGFQIWILTGFQQEDQLRQWLRIGNNLKRFLNHKITVIAVDWFPGEDLPASDILSQIQGHILGLNFKTQEAAFTAAYAAAQLLSEVNQIDPNLYPSEQTYFNSFAGGDFAGATNFNYGFYEGMRQFNTDNSTGPSRYQVRATAPVTLTASFTLTSDTKALVDREVSGQQGQRPQIIFPVAGSLSAAALDLVKAKQLNQWVIGVDTNQALAFPAHRGSILTSVEKRIAIAVYKALLTLYQLDGYDATEPSLLPQPYHLNDDLTIVYGPNDNPSNYNALGGYDEGFVGVTHSTLDAHKFRFLSGHHKDLSYAKRYDAIVDKTWATFFGDDQTPGRFKRAIAPGTDGLKPPQTVIEAFHQAIGPEWAAFQAKDGQPWGSPTGWPDAVARAAALKANQTKIMALQNVWLGGMSFANRENFFEPILAAINGPRTPGR